MTGLVLTLDPDACEQPEPFEWAGGRFGIRHTTRRKMREIRESVGLPGWPVDGERLSPGQQEKLERAVLDWQIAWWEDITDEHGNALPCDSEHRWLLVEQSPAFAELLPKWSLAVWFKRQQSARDELGNSRSSSSSDGALTPTDQSATTSAVAGSVAAAGSGS